MSDVVADWEDAATPAVDARIRVAMARTAVVLSGEGGILPRMALPFRLGAGGRIGDGRQWFSWIHVDDTVAALLRIIDDAALAGPINLAAPMPVTNSELTKTLGKVLRRPTFLPTPRLALVALYGSELVDALLYASTRAVPARLGASGFEFAFPSLEGALRAALGR